jgi:dimethylamine/trimethylamine dehydrogenase
MANPFDILFEPVKIGPVTARNRFYQVPHCNGFGHRMPQGLAAMRGMKAEGGWGAVCTEEVEIHHSSDLSPYFEGRLWSDDDLPALALMAEAVHRHGALAGIQLAYNGINASNLYSRTPALAPRSMGVIGDAEAPNLIAQAVFSGHLAAREFDEPSVEGTPFKVERIHI